MPRSARVPATPFGSNNIIAILVNSNNEIVGECQCKEELRLIHVPALGEAFFVREDGLLTFDRKKRYKQMPIFIPDAVYPPGKLG